MSPIIEAVYESIQQSEIKSALKRVAVFGSFAQDRQTDGSDVDLLVTFNRPVGFSFMRFISDLEKKLGRRIDVATPESLHPLIRNEVLSTQKIIYEE